MRGMTLIELSVVLLGLVALAGMTLMSFQSTPRYAECIATDATLANIREAIMGSAGQAGYLSDMGGMPSLDNNSISPAPPASSLNPLFNNPNGNNTIQSFNPVTQRGWRGPYITGGTTCAKIFSKVNGYSLLYGIDKENVCNLSGTPSAHTVALDSYPVIATDGTAILPGSPIVLMQDTTTNKYFLVSGGPTGGIETDPTTSTNTSSDSNNTTNRTNDDRVLYLDSYDPSSKGNQPCSQ